LGLTFCRLAVEAHGGRIWVEDSIRGGATFAFTLPIAHLSLGKEEE
jgi:NtrC-family two-component system sensor histidine kinase KinB